MGQIIANKNILYYTKIGFEQIIRHIGVLLVVAVLFTACAHSGNMTNGLFTFKSAWFIFFTGVLMIILSVDRLTGKSGFNLNRLDVMIFLLSAYMIINNAIHDSLLLSVKNIENIGLAAFYFASKRIYSEQKLPTETIIISLLTLVFTQIIIAALQWNYTLPSYNSNFRITGYFFNPAPFAIFLSALLVHCLAFFLYHSNKIIKGISITLFLAGIPVVILTFSRSAWLGLIAGVLLVLGSRLHLSKMLTSCFKNVRIKGFVIISLTISATFGLYYLYHLKKDSADGRLLTWKLSLRMVGDHLFTGIGQGNFPPSFLKYQCEYFQKYKENIPTEGELAGEVWYAFNDILQIATEQGIIGLFLFGIVLFTAVSYSNAGILSARSSGTLKTDSIKIGAIASLFVILVSGLSSYPLVMLPLHILLYHSLAVLSASYESSDIPKSVPESTSSKKIIITVIAIACLGGGIYQIKYARDLHQVYKQLHVLENSGYDGNDLEKLLRFHSILDQDHWFSIMKGTYFLNNGQYNRAISILESAKRVSSNKYLYYSLGAAYESVKNYAEAEKQYKFISYAIPNLVRPRYLLAKLYYKTGQTDKWNKQALEVIHFKSKVRSWFMEDMIREITLMYYPVNDE